MLSQTKCHPVKIDLCTHWCFVCSVNLDLNFIMKYLLINTSENNGNPLVVTMSGLIFTHLNHLKQCIVLIFVSFNMTTLTEQTAEESHFYKSTIHLKYASQNIIIK